MVKKRYYFTDEITGVVATGATTLNLKHEDIERGWEYHYQHIAVENDTSSGATARFGTYRGNSFIPAEEQSSMTVDTLYWIDDEIICTEGQKAGIYISGATAGDVIIARFRGYKIRMDTKSAEHEKEEMI